MSNSNNGGGGGSGGRPRTRQEIYDRIRESSKDEFILEEMIRLGFWPARGEVPNDPADEIRRMSDLGREITALRTEQSRLHDIAAIKKEARKRRLLASREKQKANKLRHEAEKKERTAAWTERKKKEVLFLGAGVSGGLSKGAPTNAEKLALHGLPRLETAAQIAAAMGIDVGTLRFLAYARKTSQRTHYVRFQMPKKTGGTRLISAPMPRLKRAQRWMLDNVLAKIQITESAHGFAPDRSIVTNARTHVGANVVVNLDLRNFFPTVHFRRIKGMFEGVGYGEEAATLFALLASEPDVDEAIVDGVSYFVARSARKLPQGSPASPAITNILCRRLDKRLLGMATKLGFSYTRYADDLTFSRKTAPDEEVIGKLLRRVRWIVRQEGFEEHDKKTRILRRGRRQEVTGVVVNDKPAVPRDVMKRFRAVLYQVDKDGPTGKRWGDREGDAVLESLVGVASYVAMVDPEKGRPLLAKARDVALRYGMKPKGPPPPRGGSSQGGSSQGGSSEGGAPHTGSSRGGAPQGGAAAENAPAADPSRDASSAPAAPGAPAAPTNPAPPNAPDAKKKWWKLF